MITSHYEQDDVCAKHDIIRAHVFASTNYDYWYKFRQALMQRGIIIALSESAVKFTEYGAGLSTFQLQNVIDEIWFEIKGCCQTPDNSCCCCANESVYELLYG